MNILVIRNDKLGDFITALPTLYALKQYNPKNTIMVLVAPLNEALALACDFIDEVIVDEASSFALAKRLKTYNIDASITLFSNTHVALAQFLVGIPKRIAPATKLAQFLYTKRIVQKRSRVEMPEFSYNLELTKALFSDIDTTYPSPLLACENDVYNDFVLEHGITKKVVVFHVGFGGSSDANWSVDEYIELAQSLLHVKDIQVVMSFGPDESDLMQEVSEKMEGVILYQSMNGLVEFAKLISGFSLFVSTSTGTYHLASLVGTPTMTFFGNSLFASPKRWRAIGDINIQKNYMIPTDISAREKLFLDVKAELRNSLN